MIDITSPGRHKLPGHLPGIPPQPPSVPKAGYFAQKIREVAAVTAEARHREGHKSHRLATSSPGQRVTVERPSPPVLPHAPCRGQH